MHAIRIIRLFRPIALLAIWFPVLLALALLTLACVATEHPLLLCMGTDTDEHRVPFLVTSHAVWIPREFADLDEPSGYAGGYEGYYPHAQYDAGIFPWAIYFRKNLYIPGGITHPATRPNPSLPNNGEWYEDVDDTPYEPFPNRLPLGLAYFRVWHQFSTSLVFVVPLWLPIALLLISPLRSLIEHVRKPRSQSRLCTTCGYDLCASPTRCPECGTPTPPASTKTP